QWVILSFWKMADYRASKGEDISALMGSAAAIYDYVSAEWDETVCGGGVWWSGARDYKNAVTNELYILTSANGYLRTGNQTYLDNAIKTWNWLSKSGMRNSQGLFNDGLVTATCQNNGQTTWIYNQGVIASGLANLGVATNDPSLFDQAEITLDAAIQLLTVNGVLKESCDDATSSAGQCDHDQQMFKGIFTKHLQYYLDMVNDPTRTAKYAGFLHAQESAVFHFGKNANNITGSVWYAPDQGGSVFTAETAASGIAANVASAKVCDFSI
ncbi:glycoside hydrolase family 76 protein, partial [Sphaerobolus stellatus SS14]